MNIPLFEELGLLDILVILNYFEGKKSNKTLKKIQKLQLYAQLTQDEELKKILNELKNWNKGGAK